MEIRWHGHAFFSLVCADGTRILIDPFFARTRKRAGDFSPDLLLVTHGHDDHAGHAHELGEWLERRGVADVTGMNVGGFLRRGGVRIWCAPALHSSGCAAEGGPAYGGAPCGFVVDDGETRFYHAGDTGIFGDMRTVIRDLLQPHVAALPIGDRYTMGVEHAARAVEWLGVNVAIPMHYGTFPSIEADPHDFEKRVGTAARVVVPPIDGGIEARGPRLTRALPPA